MAFASAEFIALCQSQILLLTRALGANSTVIYLAEQATNSVGLSLVPLVAYPETAEVWAGLTEALTIMAEQFPTDSASSVEMVGGHRRNHATHEPRIEDAIALGLNPEQKTPLAPDLGLTQAPPSGTQIQKTSLPPSVSGARQSSQASQESSPTLPPLVLPLIHEGVALGMLVSTRNTSTWSRDERRQAEQVANTLSLAWVLDQRGQWLQQQFQQHHLAQGKQSETFHDLLHQFRNPLTALQTFGRLLVKRMPEGDPNQPIAEGIVRESRRLQDLAETFDDAIAQGDATLLTPPTSPTTGGRLLPGIPATVGSNADPAPPTLSVAPSDTLGKAPAPDHEQKPLPRLGRSIQVVPGHLRDVLLPLIQSALAIAQERGLYLAHDLPTDLPTVWMDGVALAEVGSNLLDNALKYAPAGALIWVTSRLVQSIDGRLFQGWAVGDTGNGIPLSDQTHIFERHFRGVQAEGSIPGTGLGLAIAQELVESMGGYLELHSPAAVEPWIVLPDKPIYRGPGTVFVIWLPTCNEG